MAKQINIHEGRLALFEHLRGELMMLMGIIPQEMGSKEELQRAMDEIGDVAEAILEALRVQVFEIKDGKIYATMDIGDID